MYGENKMPNELKIIESLELVPFFTESDGVDEVLAKIAEEARAHVPDASTKKGRDAIKANVTLVTKSKTYLENKGKELAAEYKEIPKRIDATRRKTKDFLTDLQAEVRLKLTEYEDEEKRIKAAADAKIAAEKLAAEIVSDHEIAILLNEKIDRDNAEAARILADRAKAERIEYEAKIKADAERKAREDAQNIQREADERRANEERARVAEQARKDAEAQAAIDAANKAAEDARNAKIEADRKAAQDKIDAENKAIQDKIDADNRVKAAAENERIRIQRENEQLEREAKARAADTENRRTKNNEILGAMVSAGISASAAKSIIFAIAKNQIPHIQINY